MEDNNQFATADSSKQRSKLETYAPYMIQGSEMEPMTNRQYMESLSDAEFAAMIYLIVNNIGSRYTNSIKGVEQWLGEEKK